MTTKLSEYTSTVLKVSIEIEGKTQSDYYSATPVRVKSERALTAPSPFVIRQTVRDTLAIALGQLEELMDLDAADKED